MKKKKKEMGREEISPLFQFFLWPAEEKVDRGHKKRGRG